MSQTIAFYATLGFGVDFRYSASPDGPQYAGLSLDGTAIHVSTFAGDGACGAAAYCYVDNVDVLFRRLIDAGLKTPGTPTSPVEESPVDQSWGMREFYVRDPDGNTLRFGSPIEVRIVIFGNSGAGKSTLARMLADKHRVTMLELDSIVWEPNQVAVLRPREAIRADVERFLATNAQWVIEGCYGELIEMALGQCTRAVFLNPGLPACVANNRRRPWEPHKYETPQAQEAMLQPLLDWVAGYYTRDDHWSYAYHRRVFDAFEGHKHEVTDPGASD